MKHLSLLVAASATLATTLTIAPASAQGRWDYRPGDYRLVGAGVGLLVPELRRSPRGQAFVMRNFDVNRDGRVQPREAEAANEAFLRLAGPNRARYAWPAADRVTVIEETRVVPGGPGRWDRRAMHDYGFRQTPRGATLTLLAAFAALSVLVTLVYGQAYAAGRELLKGELFTLSLFVLLGAEFVAMILVIVYVGAVAAGQARRIRDAVVLKTLGATRAQIRNAWLVEFGLLGVTAGLIAAAAGTLASWGVVRFVMRMDWVFLPGTLLLTVLFVMLAEVLIYVPSIATFRLNWLNDRLAAAHTAALVLDAAPSGMVPESLARQILNSVGAHGVAMKMGHQRRLLAVSDMPPNVNHEIDMRDMAWHRAVVDAFVTLICSDDDAMRVVGPAPMGGDFLEIVMDEKPLRQAMIRFSTNILLISLLISGITAMLVYLALHYLLVRPIRRITANMMTFRADPENAARIIGVSKRRDEIGLAENELASMQGDLSSMLQQRSRLAALGLASS